VGGAAAARPEAAEVVPTHEDTGRPVHRLEVQRGLHTPGPARAEGASLGAAQQPISVLLAQGPPTRIESIWGGLDAQAADVPRQQGVEPSLQRPCRSGCRGTETDDLVTRMHPSVRATRGVHPHRLSTEELLQDRLDRLLDRPTTRLALPAHVGRAVPRKDGSPGADPWWAQ
jgi:hypothetical protein